MSSVSAPCTCQVEMCSKLKTKTPNQYAERCDKCVQS